MKRILIVCIVIAGCNARRGLQGQCASDDECTKPAICLTTQEPHICVVPQGQCFPQCQPGESCVDGACQVVNPGGCSPACPPSQACVNSVCKDVTQPSIDLTSPGPNEYVGNTVQATATAIAPGGVTSVRFEVRTTAGDVIASATATAPTAGANFAAAVSLSGLNIADGPAVIVAVL